MAQPWLSTGAARAVSVSLKSSELDLHWTRWIPELMIPITPVIFIHGTRPAAAVFQFNDHQHSSVEPVRPNRGFYFCVSYPSFQRYLSHCSLRIIKIHRRTCNITCSARGGPLTVAPEGYLRPRFLRRDLDAIVVMVVAGLSAGEQLGQPTME